MTKPFTVGVEYYIGDLIFAFENVAAGIINGFDVLELVTNAPVLKRRIDLGITTSKRKLQCLAVFQLVLKSINGFTAPLQNNESVTERCTVHFPA